MKSYKTEDVSLFGANVDETVIEEMTKLINNQNTTNNVINSTRYCACMQDCLDDRIFGHPFTFGNCFRTWFSICNPIKVEEYLKIEETKENISSINHIFFCLLSGFYTKNSIYNVIKKLYRIKYDLTYLKDPTFDRLFESIIDEKTGKTVDAIISRSESISTITQYNRMYEYYKNILKYTNDQLVERFRYIVEYCVELYKRVEMSNPEGHQYMFLNKDVFTDDSMMQPLRSEALVLLFELSFRFLSSIDINPFANIVPSKSYIENFYKTEYSTVSNDIIYIFTQNYKSILMYNLKNKRVDLRTKEQFGNDFYPYHKIDLVDKVRSLYTCHFGSKILKIKSTEKNLFLFLENGDIVANGSNKNNKITIDDYLEFTKFHNFDYKKESIFSPIKKFEITENYVLYLKENGNLYVHGNISDNKLFNKFNCIAEMNKDSDEIFYRIGKIETDNIKIDDFYINDDETSLLIYTNDKKLLLCTVDEDNGFTSSKESFTDISNLLKYDVVENEEELEELKEVEESEKEIRQIVLCEKSFVMVKGNKLIFIGKYKNQVENSFIKIEKTIDDEDLYKNDYKINKIFLLEKDNLFIEYLKTNYDETDKENVKKSFKYSYFLYGIDEDGILGGNNQEPQSELKLIDITDTICKKQINNSLEKNYSVKFNKIISDEKRTFILNNENTVFATGLNEGYFAELENDQEKSTDKLYEFKPILNEFSQINLVDDISITTKSEFVGSSIIFANQYTTACYGYYHCLGFNNTGHYLMNNVEVHDYLQNKENMSKTNKSTCSFLCSLNSFFNTNDIYKILHSTLLISDIENLNVLYNIEQFKISIQNVIKLSKSIPDNATLERSEYICDSSKIEDEKNILNNLKGSIIINSLNNYVMHRTSLIDYDYSDTIGSVCAFISFMGMISENLRALLYQYPTDSKDELMGINSEIKADKNKRIINSITNKYRSY